MSYTLISTKISLSNVNVTGGLWEGTFFSTSSTQTQNKRAEQHMAELLCVKNQTEKSRTCLKGNMENGFSWAARKRVSNCADILVNISTFYTHVEVQLLFLPENSLNLTEEYSNEFPKTCKTTQQNYAMITRKHVASSSFSTFLLTYLPPLLYSQHLLSVVCNTSFRRKPGLRPDYFQPHTAQQESTNISCTILSFHSHQQTVISDKCKTLLRSISTKQSKRKKKIFSLQLPTCTMHLNTVNQTLPTHTSIDLVKGYNSCSKANREAGDGMGKGTDCHLTAWEGLPFGKVRKQLFRDRGCLEPALMLPSLQEDRIANCL